MPTATMTTTATVNPTTIIPLKAGQPPASVATTATTLRSLYNRAARAFLHKDVVQTHSLLISAFAILQPPPLYVSDALANHRRKWDILRITLETTVYASPPESTSGDAIPTNLRDNLLLSSQSFIKLLYDRSLLLFTPVSYSQKPNASFLPSQVLITLVLSSMKVDCPDVGRLMVEDWLARRGQFEESQNEGDGYEKVLDMYCLHVLPRLEEWDYAREFLQYEGELPQDKRDALASSLNNLYTEIMEARRPHSPPRITTVYSSSAISRSSSPTPSASSSSSSVSTTSTHTAVPHTPRPKGFTPQSFSSLTPSTSSQSVMSDATVTPAPKHPHTHTRQGSNSVSTNGSISSSVSSSSMLRPPRAHPLEPAASVTRPPTTMALIRASLGPYLNSSRMSTFLFLAVLLPIMSFVLGIRRRRLRAVTGLGAARAVTAADVVRQRLAGSQGQTSIGRIWGEVVRAVSDTVRMGGGGLV